MLTVAPVERRVHNVREVIWQTVEALGSHVPAPGPHTLREQFLSCPVVAEPAQTPDLVVFRESFGHWTGNLARGASDEDLLPGKHGYLFLASRRRWSATSRICVWDQWHPNARSSSLRRVA